MTARASLTPFATYPQPGARIDDFTIAYLIAHGMSADVFAVWHHTLRVPLICKRLRATDEHEAKWRRLLRDEGVALARLKHPGIVRLIHQQQRTTLPYLLLEHVSGKTLRDALIEHGHLPTDYAVRIIQHVGGALAYAHEVGFLHRDLKPSNIIRRDGRPVLLDFGVVWKWKSARRPPDRSGTPQYLAPEQILREPLTPATDVYGLGLLLFELLTGARPFRAGTERHDQQLSLAERYPQLTDEPPALRRAGHRVSTKLEAVIARCLARNPRERFQNVGELLTALDPFTRVKVWPRNVMQLSEDFSPFE